MISQFWQSWQSKPVSISWLHYRIEEFLMIVDYLISFDSKTIQVISTLKNMKLKIRMTKILGILNTRNFPQKPFILLLLTLRIYHYYHLCCKASVIAPIHKRGPYLTLSPCRSRGMSPSISIPSIRVHVAKPSDLNHSNVNSNPHRSIHLWRHILE